MTCAILARSGPDRFPDPIQAALDGQRIGAQVVAVIAAGCSDPDALTRALLMAQEADGHLVPPGAAVRAACRAVQKALEAQHAAQ